MVFRIRASKFHQWFFDFINSREFSGNKPKAKGRLPWRPTNHFLNISRPSLRKLLIPYTALIRHSSDWMKKNKASLLQSLIDFVDILSS